VATGVITVTVGALPAGAFVGTNKSDVFIDQNNVDNLVVLGRGDDGALAGGGNDTIYAGAGSDQIFGGDGNDLIVGGAGGDYLYGEYGNDTLVGGAGADTFAFTDFWNDDVIVGFDPKHDKIQLPAVYFSSFDEVKAAAHDDGHGNLVISTPDHTGSVSSITLVGVSVNALKASEFVFI
jgi:Ca2+-binding RTX toxin-like protein